MSLAPAIDIAVYLLAYFVRLRAMSRAAKGDASANMRFFVEEQTIATPVAVALVLAVALIDRGPIGGGLQHGLSLASDLSIAPWIVVIGLCSQGTGIFGALVLLDARENTFSVPVNRASSVLAGVVATIALWLMLGADGPDLGELIGAVLLIAAVLVLSLGPRLSRRS
jgi:hypothetical protein